MAKTADSMAGLAEMVAPEQEAQAPNLAALRTHNGAEHIYRMRLGALGFLLAYGLAGEPLRIRQVADAFGVHNEQARSALRILTREGLAQETEAGTFVPNWEGVAALVGQNLAAA